MPTIAMNLSTSSPIVIVDGDDAPAISAYMELTTRGTVVYCKKPAWQRWKPLSVYLTGAICSHRNGNNLDFRRENLEPCARAWDKYR